MAKENKTVEDASFEAALARLEEIVDKMELPKQDSIPSSSFSKKDAISSRYAAASSRPPNARSRQLSKAKTALLKPRHSKNENKSKL